MIKKDEVLYFGGGCFWCVEAVFDSLKGVKRVTSGYMGGFVDNPNYSEVCSGSTGHAEVVKVEFDAEIISIETLLTFFFHVHDPTTLNRQGMDVGTQYRSVIFCSYSQQKIVAEKIIDKLEKTIYLGSKVVTQVMLINQDSTNTSSKEKNTTVFWKAEDYHQNYFSENKHAPYCQAVIVPKLEKVKEFSKKLI